MDNETLSRRNKARLILLDLRRDYSGQKVAEMLGIPRAYVYFAIGKHQQSITRSYCCPLWAIKRILEFGALLGYRRQIIKPDIPVHVAE